jgi:hypothetical protein
MTTADYEKLYEALVQSLIDRPPDPIVVRHTIGLLKALDRWLLTQSVTQPRDGAALASSHRGQP